MRRFTIRRYDATVADSLIARGIEEPLARALAARGLTHPDEASLDIRSMLPPAELKNANLAAEILADAIQNNKKIVIIGDYDCDGATATSIGYIGLQLLGAKQVSYLIPDREKDGYGLSKNLVDKAIQSGAELIITVDNGISAIEAVDYAKSAGIQVIVTDHHLPGRELPKADCIVDPSQPGDTFKSKSIAGCGVIFYVLIALRSELRKRGVFDQKTQPNLMCLIDLVALGTVADVVPFDQNNRILVKKGLENIRRGFLRPGIAALLCKSKRNANSLSSSDLAFAIAPRINAAGRLGNMETGIQCLLASDINVAAQYAEQLDSLNNDRKQLEKDGLEEAMQALGTIDSEESSSLCVFRKSWHLGVIGLVASRLRERIYRPTICFGLSNEIGSNGEEIKGSGRSIPGIHLRDVLDAVDKREPGLILKFGGHAQAAGLTIRKADFERFKKIFDEEVSNFASEDVFHETLETDGELTAGDLYNANLVRNIREYVWGQNFPEPVFMNRFRVVKQELLNGAHLRLRLETDGVEVPGIWFRKKKEIPRDVILAYKLGLNEWGGRTTVQLIIEAMEDPMADFGA